MQNFDDFVVNSEPNNEKQAIEKELDLLNRKLNAFDEEKNNILKLFRKNLIDENEV
jgi:hypothetical protein